MKQRVLPIATLVILGTLALTAMLAQAQTISNGPYYATPSWDQTLPSNTGFIVLSNFGGAAVLDRETGLVWERSPDPAVINWFDAAAHCRGLTTGNRQGWRLPSINELQTLVDPSTTEPSLPPGHPFSGIITATFPSHIYWSSTIDTQNGTTNVFGTDFANGSGSVTVTRSSATGPGGDLQRHAWCVRGQGGTESQ